MCKVRKLLEYHLLLISASLSSAVQYRIDRDHYDKHGYPVLKNIENGYDFSYARITAGAQRYEDARNSRRQAVQGSTSYRQTITTTFIGTDGFTTVPYATNGQQCSTISNDIMAVRDPNGIEYIYMCGGAVSGVITHDFQAASFSACMPAYDTSPNCTACSYNSGANFGMQNAAGQGRCTYKTDNNGMAFTTSNMNQLQSTRVAGMQKLAYMRTFFPTTTTTSTTTSTTSTTTSTTTTTYTFDQNGVYSWWPTVPPP